jgi:hypothetical protein
MLAGSVHGVVVQTSAYKFPAAAVRGARDSRTLYRSQIEGLV